MHWVERFVVDWKGPYSRPGDDVKLGGPLASADRKAAVLAAMAGAKAGHGSAAKACQN